MKKITEDGPRTHAMGNDRFTVLEDLYSARAFSHLFCSIVDPQIESMGGNS
jgi:hypothetical protein